MDYDTIYSILEQHEKQRPEDICMILANTNTTITYEKFKKDTDQIAKQLKEQGLKNKNRVLLVQENGYAFAVSFFGVCSAKGVAVPVNPALKEKEYRYILEDSKASFVLTTRKSGENNLDLQASGTIKMTVKHTIKDSIKDTDMDFNERSMPGAIKESKDISAHSSRESLKQSQTDIYLLSTKYQNEKVDEKIKIPADTALLLYTSGSTGQPKGVLLSHANVLAKAKHIAVAHELTKEDTVMCVLPWFHINGLVITLITPLTLGGCLVVADKFSVSRFWSDVLAYKVTWFSGVPTMFSFLLAKKDGEHRTGNSLRFARSASSPLPLAVLKEFEEYFHTPLIESYGMTEGCSQITTNPMPPMRQKPGSVGLPYGNEIRIVKANGTEGKPYEQGEVWIRGENITCGYLNKELETEKAFTKEWFHSGDLGYLDDEGYLFLTGRIKELINRAGEKFSPREIDEVLFQLPQVKLAAAVGVPDEIYGEAPVAFVQLKEQESISEEEVKAFCMHNLAAYKVPTCIFFVSELPTGGNGKIQRLKLVDLYKRRIMK